MPHKTRLWWALALPIYISKIKYDSYIWTFFSRNGHDYKDDLSAKPLQCVTDLVFMGSEFILLLEFVDAVNAGTVFVF